VNYLDTSALIKRFVVEKGSPLVQSIVTREGPAATAKIAYAEVHAGLMRKRRERHLSPGQYASVCRQFEADWPAYVRVEIQDGILLLARDLIRRHPLKGLDALHLASAIALRRRLGEEITFAAADRLLLRAARAERLQALDVESATPP
jgi:predicted nucleic acid-binding protein